MIWKTLTGTVTGERPGKGSRILSVTVGTVAVYFSPGKVSTASITWTHRSAKKARVGSGAFEPAYNGRRLQQPKQEIKE